MSLDDLIKMNVSCTRCGSKGYMSCDCWERCCECGCFFAQGGACRHCSDGQLDVVATGVLKLGGENGE